MSPSPLAPENLVSPEPGSAVPSRVSLLLILDTQAESGAYSRNSSRFRWRRLFIYPANRHRASHSLSCIYRIIDRIDGCIGSCCAAVQSTHKPTHAEQRGRHTHYNLDMHSTRPRHAFSPGGGGGGGGGYFIPPTTLKVVSLRGCPTAPAR